MEEEEEVIANLEYLFDQIEEKLSEFLKSQGIDLNHPHWERKMTRLLMLATSRFWD